MMFVRYILSQVIEEDLLFCRPLKTTTKAADVLKLIEDFFEEEELDWDKLGSACTDEAPAMLGARSGFLELIKRKNSKTMSLPLKQTLNSAVKVIKYIKASDLNTRLFEKLCQDMGAEYESLLFFTFCALALKRGRVDSACAFTSRGH